MSPGSSENSKSSTEKVFVKSKNGGAGRRTAPPADALEPMEIPEEEAAPVEEKKPEPEAVLTEGAWSKSATLFQE